MNVFLFTYEISLYFLAFLAIPKALYSCIFHKKYRKSFLSRIGWKSPDFTNIKEQSIWIHAASVGETKAVANFAKIIKQCFPTHSLIISSVTETGHGEAKQSIPFADHHIYLPFDFRWAISRIIKKTSPALVILSESDFWLHFLYFAKKQGAKIALVNGKISERSLRRFQFFSFFSRKLFELIDLFSVQNKMYADRFAQLAISNEKIVISGNLKVDDEYTFLSAVQIAEIRSKYGIDSQDVVLTIGSTHAPEEQLFIDTLKKIWQFSPLLRVILVPRHLERIKEITNLLKKENVSWVLASSFLQETKSQLILVDAMGTLKTFYQIADFAIVAGSFTSKVGGHNIIEPCGYGKPVLFGPYMHSQLEFLQLVKHYTAGLQVNEQELFFAIKNWIENPLQREEIGQRGLRLVKELKGATQRTLQALESIYKIT